VEAVAAAQERLGLVNLAEDLLPIARGFIDQQSRAAGSSDTK